MASDHQVLILGAGPSGLGSGLGLLLHDYPGKISVIERRDRPGGLAGSFSWNGHTIDYGPHRLSPNIAEIRMLASELLGPDLLLQKSQHGVQLGGRLYQFPPRVMDWANPRSLWELGRFGTSYAAAKLGWVTRRFEQDTFESIITRKFGRRFYARIVAPMSEKVWISPDRIDPAFAELRFAQVQPRAVLRRILFPKQELNPATFYYPRRGYQQIWSSMADWLQWRGHELLYESEATAVHVDGTRIRAVDLAGPWGKRTVSGEDLTVVSTIPLALLVRLLTGFEVGEMLNDLARVKVRSMILVAFEFSQPETLPYRTLIFPERRFHFNRLFEQNRYSRACVAAGKSVVVSDTTLDPDSPLLDRSDEHLVELVRRDLERLPYIDVSRISDATVRRVPYAYVVPDVGTREAMFAVLHRLKAISNLILLGRFSVGEYDNSDYAIDHGLRVGAMLSGRVSPLRYLTEMHEKSSRNIVG
jgi:protoporphyrinogen oxidase